MEQHVIGLTRQNLPELEAIEKLAEKIGAEPFEALAMQLANNHVINVEDCRQCNPGLIGMTDEPFRALQKVCESVLVREPKLLVKLTYRSRDSDKTALPHGLWLQIVEHAQRT
jgi:hypothetical protein